MENKKLTRIVKSVQAGDREAAGELYQQSYQELYYFILKTVKEKDLAEDLTQDTFIQIMESIGRLQAPEAYVTWSRQIAYHCCMAYFRKHKELLADENEDGQTVFDTVTEENAEFIPHEALDREDLKQTILGMLDSLPAEQKAAMILRYYEELPVSKIAEIQNVSEGTVKSRLNYGRKAIRSSVEEYEKKNGIKLHSFAILPLLLWLLRKKRLAEGLSITATKGSKVVASVGSGTAVKATGTVAKTAAKKGFLSTLAGKITAAVLAVAVAGGAMVAGFSGTVEHKDRPEVDRRKPAVHTKSEKPGRPTQKQERPTETDGWNTLNRDCMNDHFRNTQIQPEMLVLTNQAVPGGVETEDFSYNGDGSVLMWRDGTTMYITTADGGTLYAPVDSGSLFNNGGYLENPSILKQITFENFDTSRVQNMNAMFSWCYELETLDVSGWDVSNVTDMGFLFYGCESLQAVDVSKWDVSNVTDIGCIFDECRLLETIDVSNWDTSSMTQIRGAFSNCSSLKSLDVSKWDVSNVTDISQIFSCCASLETVDVSQWDVSNVTDMSFAFGECEVLKAVDVSKWDVSNVTDIVGMFYRCYCLETVDVSKWDTSNMTMINELFFCCESLKTVDMSKWDVSNVIAMKDVFTACYALETVDVSQWDVSNVTNMTGMFQGCYSLTELDVSNWNVSGVNTSMASIFEDCRSIKSLDVSRWDVSNVTNMDDMFRGCSSLETLDVSNWNVSNVANMRWMFYDCSSLETLDVSNWRVRRGALTIDMFMGTSINAELVYQ